MAEINVNPSNTRIMEIRQYLFTVLDSLLNDSDYQINANFLSKDVNNYSVDRIPVADMYENWIIPLKKKREIYLLRSRNRYGVDVLENLKNIGFFETLEDLIYSNNKKGILPNIENIESIECLNVGALNTTTTNTAEFSIQIQIIYRKITKIATSL